MTLLEAHQNRDAEVARTSDAPDGAKAHALSHALNLPVTALRASMEALRREIPRRDEGHVLLSGALEEVVHIGNTVEDLLAWADCPEPMPLPTRPGEVLATAWRGLEPADYQKLNACVEGCPESIDVDGPLLAGALRRLVRNALEARASSVLLIARTRKDQMTFTVVDDAPLPFDPTWACKPFHSTKEGHLGLGLALVERDLACMNASLHFEGDPGGPTRAVVLIPLASCAGGQGA